MVLPASAFHNLSTAAGSQPETRVSLVEGASPKHSRVGGIVRGLGMHSTCYFTGTIPRKIWSFFLYMQVTITVSWYELQHGRLLSVAGALWVLDGCLYIQTQEANCGLSLDLNAELPQTSGCHSVPGDCTVSLAPWPSVAINARGCRDTVDALLIRNMKQRPAETRVQLRAVQREGDLSCKQQKVFFSPA